MASGKAIVVLAMLAGAPLAISAAEVSGDRSTVVFSGPAKDSTISVTSPDGSRFTAQGGALAVATGLADGTYRYSVTVPQLITKQQADSEKSRLNNGRSSAQIAARSAFGTRVVDTGTFTIANGQVVSTRVVEE